MRLYPPGPEGQPAARDPLRIYDEVVLPEGRETPAVAINMVSTVDGKVTLARSAVREPIGSEVDRGLMARLRGSADAVIRGASTVRRDPYYPRVPEDLAERRRARGLPDQPLAVVVSGSCELPLDAPFFRRAPRRPVVITAERAAPERVEAARAVADVIVAGDDEVDIRAALRALGESHGAYRLLCEGGPTLNHACFRAGVVDTLFWTVAPKVGGLAEDLTLVAGPALLDPMPRLELVSAWFHEGELFLRYRVLR